MVGLQGRGEAGIFILLALLQVKELLLVGRIRKCYPACNSSNVTESFASKALNFS